ncbi:NAD(P)H-binding protein [Saccharopolyspora indica]|uniref:NAD(P)-dependent oxidoreductase n=1 Tax=Saccharopolyspora indica TaxID=1229659 RepID=UPI0022EB16DF|nr:NAD(P)H-binding protein [Saccharopolyspora indica]MDA3649877.1 NAD(P)H-binding protein [Saccharopolyspora indica]
MKITVIGATGMAGSRITAEAVRRGHHVTAVSRSGAPLPGATAVRADVTDGERMRDLFAGADAIVGATRPAPGQEHVVGETTTALLDAATGADRRVLVVGGAGPLRTPGDPDRLVVDDPAYVAAEWRTIAAASVAQLEVCRAHQADWTYLSPPAVLEPGERTGHYRRGGTTLLVGPDGTSRISAEDFAVAVLDELENPSGAKHFTVAS